MSSLASNISVPFQTTYTELSLLLSLLLLLPLLNPLTAVIYGEDGIWVEFTGILTGVLKVDPPSMLLLNRISLVLPSELSSHAT